MFVAFPVDGKKWFMAMRRQLSSGLSVFAAVKVCEGPPEVWIALGTDARVSPVRAVLGFGSTVEDAEVDAVVQLGAIPSGVRAVVESHSR